VLKKREKVNMSDDLVKRLRWLGDHASFEPHMHHTAADRIEKLEAALREIHEVYAGSEGIPEPMTAAESYLLKLLTEIVGVTRKALEGKDDR
jgi:hypothetical protein